MARWKSGRTETVAKIYDAAQDIKDRCLINDGSVFTDDNLWTMEGVNGMIKYFVENSKFDNEKDSFIDKFKKQLEPAPEKVQKLAAEIIWLMRLAQHFGNMKPETKRKQICIVWSWKGDTKQILNHDYLRPDDILSGIGGTGKAYNMNFPYEMKFAIRFIESIKKIEANKRSMIFSDPWQFTQWFDNIEAIEKCQFRLIIQNLLFPDEFESVFTRSQRKDILSGYNRKNTTDLDNMTDEQIDRELLQLRKELEKIHRTPNLDFYHPPLQSEWSTKPPVTPTPVTIDPPDPNDQVDYILSTQSLNQIFYGPPGTGKTFKTINMAVGILDHKILGDASNRKVVKAKFEEFKNNGRVEFVTFHQSFSYEDFVEGLKAVAGEKGGITFKVEDGVFKRLCEKCVEAPELPHILIIDEINRGNISSIFGELITLIEPTKRKGAEEELTVTLPYSKETFAVPGNLYIIGTMNTADRSLVQVDTALRRRFRFVEMMPDTDLLEGIDVDDVNVKLMLEAMNKRIELLYDREHTIGHSFFLPLDDVENPGIDMLADIFRHEILPLLEEYFFEDWGRIQQVLGDNQKSGDSLRFYKEKFTGGKIDDLLGLNGPTDPAGDVTNGFQTTPYERNEQALLNPDAYIGIYDANTRSVKGEVEPSKPSKAESNEEGDKT